VKELADLSQEEADALLGSEALSTDRADRMIENVVGTFQLPLGIATNFQIDGRDYLVPMAVEEPSVVAGASYAARLFREGGGFTTSYTGSIMSGQIQLVDLPSPQGSKLDVLAARERILDLANRQDPPLVQLGGGAKDLEARILEGPRGSMLVVHLLVDLLDAMGANAVNTMAEAVAPLLEELTGGKAYLRILSNLADRRIARAKGIVPRAALNSDQFPGEDVVDGILWAYSLAAVDPYRAATHNKGIMNGIDPVVIATGNDWRAIEAGAHAFAARNGRYAALTAWERNADGDLVGSIELPMAVGLVGGATKVHPAAQVAVRILGVASAEELARIIAAVGLAQNLAALRALATEGIQRGHMSLHARNVAAAAGASGEQIDEVAAQMAREGVVREDRAREILSALEDES
jgi:hydroxymethylglutaryl-CoA reductase